MTRSLFATCVAGLWIGFSGGVLAVERPVMTWDDPIECVDDGAGRFMRLQCTQKEGRKVCLTSGRFVLGDDGKESEAYMEDLRSCGKVQPWERLEELKKEGWQFSEALAEAPEGFARDESGRLFQVTFDLRNRFHLGAYWNPLLDSDGEELGRTQFDFGWRAYELGYSRKERDNYRGIEGRVALEPLEFSFLAFGYDSNVNSDEPVFWVTTFIGPPTRWDVSARLGWGIRTLKVDYHPMRSKSVEFENVALYGSWDIAHNSSMANYFRLAAGFAVGQLFNEVVGVNSEGAEEASVETRVYLDPLVMLGGEFELDDAGLHHLGLNLAGSARLMFDDFSSALWVAKAALTYEWVVLAVNDQPVSVYVEASGQYREDLPDVPQKYEARGLLGLRFSFWAPPQPGGE